MKTIRNVVLDCNGVPQIRNEGQFAVILVRSKSKDPCKGCALTHREDCGVRCFDQSHFKKISSGDMAISESGDKFSVELVGYNWIITRLSY